MIATNFANLFLLDPGEGVRWTERELRADWHTPARDALVRTGQAVSLRMQGDPAVGRFASTATIHTCSRSMSTMSREATRACQ